MIHLKNSGVRSESLAILWRYVELVRFWTNDCHPCGDVWEDMLVELQDKLLKMLQSSRMIRLQFTVQPVGGNI